MVDTILRNQPAVLSHTVYVGDEKTAPDAGLTVDVSSLDGTDIAANEPASTTDDAAIFEFSLNQSNVDILRVTWKGDVGGETYEAEQYVEIAGGTYAPIPVIRQQRSLGDATRFTDEEVARERRAAEAVIEDATGVAYVPRALIYVFDGEGMLDFEIPKLKGRDVVRAYADGEALDVSGWITYPDGLVIADSPLPRGRRNVTVLIEHGYSTPPPAIMGAFYPYVRYRILGDENGMPDRATSLSIEGGTFEIATAGAQRPTGLPEVDAVLLRASEKTPTIL